MTDRPQPEPRWSDTYAVLFGRGLAPIEVKAIEDEIRNAFPDGLRPFEVLKALRSLPSSAERVKAERLFPPTTEEIIRAINRNRSAWYNLNAQQKAAKGRAAVEEMMARQHELIDKHDPEDAKGLWDLCCEPGRCRMIYLEDGEPAPTTSVMLDSNFDPPRRMYRVISPGDDRDCRALIEYATRRHPTWKPPTFRDEAQKADWKPRAVSA